MQESEIHNKTWTIIPDLKRITNRVTGLQPEEQECTINVLKAGLTDIEKPEIQVDCSYSEYITELAKSEYFTLTEILVSDNPLRKGSVLAIKGILKLKGLTIRKKIPVFSEEDKKRRSDQAKINLNSKKNK